MPPKRATSLEIPPPGAREVCLHVLVIGFDHEIGNVLEYVYPPLPEPEPEPELEAEQAGLPPLEALSLEAAGAGSDTSADDPGSPGSPHSASGTITSQQLPKAWDSLTFQAMPDGPQPPLLFRDLSLTFH